MTNHSENAYELAQASAEDIGIEIRSGTPNDADSFMQLCSDVWGANRIPNVEFIYSLLYAGNGIQLAYNSENKLIGGVCGFVGLSGGLHFHSYLSAVAYDSQNLGVGATLKLAQRAWALRNNINEIRWYFDPLSRRNAHLYCVKLGAEVRHYYKNAYGIRQDQGGLDDYSDRFELSWDLLSTRVRRLLSGVNVENSESEVLYSLELPKSYNLLRQENIAEADEFRHKSQEVFSSQQNEGNKFVYDKKGSWVFVKK